MVAKSYQGLATFGEPFEENKKMYIVVVTSRGAHKKVRWYTDAEYAKMYPDEAPVVKRIRPVKDVLGFSKNEIKKVQSLQKANITVRNFPESVQQLRKRLKLSDGGDSYIFATTLSDERKVLILCNK